MLQPGLADLWSADMVAAEALCCHAPCRAHPSLHRHGLPARSPGGLSSLRAGHVSVPEPRSACVFVRAGRANSAGGAGTAGANLAGTLQSACIAAAPDRLRGGEGPDELDRAAGRALPVLLQPVVTYGSGLGSRLVRLRTGALVLAAGTGPALPDRRRGACPCRARQGAALSLPAQRGIRGHDPAREYAVASVPGDRYRPYIAHPESAAAALADRKS